MISFSRATEKRDAREDTPRPYGNREIQEKSQRCTLLTCDEFSNHRHGNQVYYLSRTQKRKHKGTDDSFQSTKPSMGNGLDNSNYLLIVDYHSRFFEVVKLQNTKSATIITQTKSIFGRLAIPSEVIGDNGPNIPLVNSNCSLTRWSSSIPLSVH